jgi:Phage integrase family
LTRTLRWLRELPIPLPFLSIRLLAFAADINSMSRWSAALSRAVAKAQIPKKLTAHTLRHTFATHLLDSGVDNPTCAGVAEHSDVSTTLIYTHVLSSPAAGTLGRSNRCRVFQFARSYPAPRDSRGTQFACAWSIAGVLRLSCSRVTCALNNLQATLNPARGATSTVLGG